MLPTDYLSPGLDFRGWVGVDNWHDTGWYWLLAGEGVTCSPLWTFSS